MRVYLAGPMTGIPHYNIPAFDEAAERLRGLGLDVVSPAELDTPEDRAAAYASPDGSALLYEDGTRNAYWDFLERDLRIIATDGIEAIVVMDGWADSRGARIETFVGYVMGLPIMRLAWFSGYRVLEQVEPLTLYRAWASEPKLYSYNTFDHIGFGVTVASPGEYLSDD